MNLLFGAGDARRLVTVGLFLLTAFLLLAHAGDVDAKKKAKKAKVTLKVLTKNQKQLLKQGKLTVRVKSTAKTRVKLTSNGFKAKAVKFRKKGVKKVKLRMKPAGKKRLSKCGAKKVKVVGKYKSGKKKKKRKAATKKRLKKDKNRCVKPVTVDLGENPETCDFLDTTVCLQPFPNDYYTKKDGSTETGLRLNLDKKSTPVNTGAPANRQRNVVVTDINRADGFSPGPLITLKVPGLDTPAAFQNSGLVGLENMSHFSDPDQPVMLIDADTGERQLIWAEIDANPTAVDPGPGGPGGINQNPSNTGPVNLLVRPGKNLEFGKRYIIAFRNLKDQDDKQITSPLGFRVYRDNLPTKQNIVENRRSKMNSIIKTLVDKAGVKRNSLYMAWDFTVASEQSVTGRATTIRDDAFKRLGDGGDPDLANRKIEGASPKIDVLAWCDKSSSAAPVGAGPQSCGNNFPGTNDFKPTQPVSSPNPDSRSQRTVVGLIRDVPCYLDEDGCPSGSEFAFDANGKLSWNPSFKTDVPFSCVVPMATVAGGKVHPGGTGTYGHGLLGTLSQVRSTRTTPNDTNSTFCATNWSGFSDLDLSTVLRSLGDMSYFNQAVDRMQQGFVNFLMLQRALAHPQGMATEPALHMDYDGTTAIPTADQGSAIDTSKGADTRGYYLGKSQGGIMGGALVALSPDVDHGVLDVPGINYSTLLRRSVDSDEYFRDPTFGLYKNYPDLAERPLLLGLMQLLWDRGEGNGYAHNLTDKPLPNTNPHEVLLKLALGDHQVTNYAAEVEARTIAAKRYAPSLLPARTWDLDYEALPPVSDFPAGPGDSFMVYYDGGPVGYTSPDDEQGTALPPLENVPPRPEWGYGGDPHSYPADSVDGAAHTASFLMDGTIQRCADPSGYCFSNGWDGSSGMP